jgi:hypothetical protein
MQRQIQLLRQLVRDSQYAVDEATVADAILARAIARRAVMGAAFRNDIRDAQTSAQARVLNPGNRARSLGSC